MFMSKSGKRGIGPFGCVVTISSLVGLSALAGCGGGGSTPGVPPVSNPSPGSSATSSIVSGAVTDINGAPIVGAAVTLNNLTATTTQGGSYVIPNVVVPANQASLITAINATATVNGRPFSGQNTVEVLNGEANTSNVNIVVSDTAAQGSIGGTVRDVGGNPLPNSRVFVAPGPVQQSNGALAFSNLSSFSVYADSSGRYLVPKLPFNVTYTAVASYPGHLNQTLSNLVLTSGNLTGIDFSITASNTSPVLPAVQNFAAVGFTFPALPTRSVSGLPSGAVMSSMDTIKAWVLQSHGFKQKPFANTARMWTRSTLKRTTPAGLLIETDLLWDYTALNNLYGYSIVRSTGAATNFIDIATLRDPLADRFDDLDSALTPGTNYFYNVGRLDTINFPKGVDTSSSNPADVTIQVQPLNAIQIQQPAPNKTVSATPTITWNAVANAASYQVLVYDRFPNYQSDTAGVAPIWPQNAQQPGTSLVAAPATQAVYAGPALQSGHTYYVVVLAQFAPANNNPAVGTTISISPIQAFSVQ